MTDLIYKKGDDGAWETVVDGGFPIDDVISFTETPGAGPLVPIISLDNTTGETVVGGDHTDRLLRGAPYSITGSTGNDGDYSVSDAGSSYDGGLDQTTFISGAGSYPDATQDGDVQLAGLYTATVALPADTFVEWIYAVTTAAWSSPSHTEIYSGDDVAGFDAWMQADHIGDLDAAFQWPTATVDKNAQSGDYSTTRILPLPSGALVTVTLLALDGGSPTGRTTVILHHHHYQTSDATKS